MPHPAASPPNPRSRPLRLVAARSTTAAGMASRNITFTYADGARGPQTVLGTNGTVRYIKEWLASSAGTDWPGAGVVNPSRIPLEEMQLFAMDRADSELDELPDDARLWQYARVGVLVKRRGEPLPGAPMTAAALERRLPHISAATREALLKEYQARPIDSIDVGSIREIFAHPLACCVSS